MDLTNDVTIDPACRLDGPARALLLEHVSELTALGTPFTLHVMHDRPPQDFNILASLMAANAPLMVFSRASRVLVYDADGVRPC